MLFFSSTAAVLPLVSLLFKRVVSQATGLSNGVTLLSPSTIWFLDAKAVTPPDVVIMFPDVGGNTCQTNTGPNFGDCPAPCGEQGGPNAQPFGQLAVSSACDKAGTIQQQYNQIFGNDSYFAFETYSDPTCNSLLSLGNWYGEFSRAWKAERCVRIHSLYPFSAFFQPSKDGSIYAGRFPLGGCSGPPTNYFFTREGLFFPSTVTIPEKYVTSTGCVDISEPLAFMNFTVIGVDAIYGRFYSSYSVGGNKFGQNIARATPNYPYSVSGSESYPSFLSLALFLVLLSIF